MAIRAKKTSKRCILNYERCRNHKYTVVEADFSKMSNAVSCCLDFVKNAVKNIVSNVNSHFENLTFKKKIVCLSLASSGIALLILHLKRAKEQQAFDNKIKDIEQQGYYLTNSVTALYESSSKNIPSTINSFHICKDVNFPFSKCVQFWTNMAVEHLAFRSISQCKLGTYFWIECSKVALSDNCKMDGQFSNGIDNIQLNQELNRKQFYQRFGFDLISHVKLSHCNCVILIFWYFLIFNV